MKQILSWMGKRVASAVFTAVFFVLTVLGIVYAVSYPSTPPVGKVAGGNFMDYFNKILIDTGTTSDGTVKKAAGLQISTGAVAGRVLTSDGNGNGTWQDPVGGGGIGGDFIDTLINLDEDSYSAGLHATAVDTCPGTNAISQYTCAIGDHLNCNDRWTSTFARTTMVWQRNIICKRRMVLAKVDIPGCTAQGGFTKADGGCYKEYGNKFGVGQGGSAWASISAGLPALAIHPDLASAQGVCTSKGYTYITHTTSNGIAGPCGQWYSTNLWNGTTWLSRWNLACNGYYDWPVWVECKIY